MALSKKELLSYFVPLSDEDGIERSVRVKGCFNTYLIRRKGTNSMHYYLRQRLVVRSSGKHISINHGCWEDNNIPDVHEFKQLMAFCNCCYFAAVSGLNPTELEDLSMFAGITNKNRRNTRRIFQENALSFSSGASSDTDTTISTRVNSDVDGSSGTNPRSLASHSFITKEGEERTSSDSTADNPARDSAPSSICTSTPSGLPAVSCCLSVMDLSPENSVCLNYCCNASETRMGFAGDSSSGVTIRFKHTEDDNPEPYAVLLPNSYKLNWPGDPLFGNTYSLTGTSVWIPSTKNSTCHSSTFPEGNECQNGGFPLELSTGNGFDSDSPLQVREILSVLALLIQNGISSDNQSEESDELYASAFLLLVLLLSEEINRFVAAERDSYTNIFNHSHQPPMLSDSWQNTSHNPTTGDSDDSLLAHSSNPDSEYNSVNSNSPDCDIHKSLQIPASGNHPDSGTDPLEADSVFNNICGKSIPATVSHKSPLPYTVCAPEILF